MSVCLYRSNCLELFKETGASKNFAKFTGEHLSWGVFLNKVVGWRPASLLKKRLQQRCFLKNFARTSRKVFQEHPCMASYVV